MWNKNHETKSIHSGKISSKVITSKLRIQHYILLMATRNPNSPVEVGSWNPIIYEVLYMPGRCFGISEPPTSPPKLTPGFPAQLSQQPWLWQLLQRHLQTLKPVWILLPTKGDGWMYQWLFLVPWKTWAWWYIYIYRIYNPPIGRLI